MNTSTSSKQKYAEETRRAKEMMRLHPNQINYWTGYQSGIRRAYFGKALGTEDDHAVWMGLIHRPDAGSIQSGEGYRDGMEVMQMFRRVGRPYIGVRLEKLRVPVEIKNALVAKAKELGLTLYEVRRLAYEEFLGKVKL